MNLARTGAAGVLGLASGAITPPTVAPIQIMAGPPIVNIEAGTILEAVALIGGALVQQFSPYTAPDITDGLVDGGLSLLLRRGGIMAAKVASGKPPFGSALSYGGYGVGAWSRPAGVGAAAYGSIGGARGVTGGVAEVSRRELV